MGTNGLWQCAEWGIQEEIKGETKVLQLGDRLAMPLELHTEDSQDADDDLSLKKQGEV